MPWLINATQLDKFRKNQKALVIFDASWHLPAEARDAKQEYEKGHIMGAQFFDITLFNDTSPTAPHSSMVKLDEKSISDTLSAMGVRNDYKIIFYDNSKLHTSCRALWMLKLFGHNPQLLYILDGGLPAWNAYGGKIETGDNAPSAKPYQASIQPQYLRTLADMKENLQTHAEQVIDVRHAVRYAGGPDGRAGLRPGHMPGSFSFPYTSLFDKNNCWRPLEKIRQVYTSIGAEIQCPTVTSCGSGVTAPILNFALDLLGNTANAVYNGSWTEWGAETLHPNETSNTERPVITSLDGD